MKKLTLLLVLLMLVLFAYANDLDCVSVAIDPNITPTVGIPVPCVVTVHNNGTNLQTGFQVKLFHGADIEVGTATGFNLAPGVSWEYYINWTPDTAGPDTLYGKVFLTGDENPANDQSPDLNVTVLPAGLVGVNVGSGNQQALVPVNMYYRTSLFETIYLSSEMNVCGLITTLRFYNNFSTNIPASPTVIWLGETAQTDLSSGWILANQLTQVFGGPVDYPSGVNAITIPLTTPFVYNGGNLVLLVHRPWDDDYYSSMDIFRAQTVGNSRSLTVFNDNTSINPDSPPTTGTTGQFPQTTFFISVLGTGSLSGTVTAGGIPVEGATVWLADDPHTTLTDAQGHYNFPYIRSGSYNTTAEKTGYTSATHTVDINDGLATTQNFSLTQFAQVTVSGRVLSTNAPTVGIANAEVSLSGYAPYQTVSDDQGLFTFPSVYGSNAYTLHIEAAGYQDFSQDFNLGSVNAWVGDFYLNEIAYPPRNVTATESGSNISLTWDAPSAAQEGWLHYDNGENFNSFGTAGSLSFDVAIRYPASVLAPYAGASLQAVKIWPAQGGNFSVRVWTGGDAANPGEMVVDQPIIPILNSYNTIMLNEPVYITGTEELWFGFLCDVTGVNPAYAGVDPGPAVNGFSNMIYWQGNWTTLLAVNSYCDFNWNIQGYVGLDVPEGLAPLTLIKSEGQSWQNDPGAGPERITAYKVWRLLQGQENNEAGWTSLTPNPIIETSFQDSSWSALPDGTYLWAVKAIYLNNVLSDPVFSNPLTKTTQVGSIAGIVRNMQNLPIINATISCGSVTATTNSTGAYSMMVDAGTHSISASHAGYQTATYDGIVVLTGETTHVNFQLLTNSPNDDPNGIPLVTDLTGISPNPFRTGTSVSYALKESAPLSIDIYNLRGQLVRQIVHANTPAGYHSVDWDGKDASGNAVSVGVYFCRMSAGKETFTRRLVLLK